MTESENMMLPDEFSAMSKDAELVRSNSASDLDYPMELERTKSQLLVFAREMGAVYQQQRKQSARMNEMVEELKTDYLAVIQTLALVVEAKDEYTRYHLERCKEYGIALVNEIDPSLSTPELHYGFLLHDVGKIGIREDILSKAGPLTADEMKIMRMHPLIGVQIVGPMRRILNEETIDVIRHHHERFDGQGYPDKLKGEAIPLGARIFSVVDAFDAMTTDRPYRNAMSFTQAMERIRLGSGTQFDPDVVTSFAGLIERLPNPSPAVA